MNYQVKLNLAAEEDLARLFDFLFERATTVEVLDTALTTVRDLRETLAVMLSQSPYSFRKSRRDPHRRELVIPLRATGYVALYEIEGDRVIVLAIRHQRENDYH